jgi:Uridine phosphorylase
VSVTSTGMGCPSTAICQSKDSFYGEVDPDSSPVAKRLKERWEAWKRGNVLASEMEAAALFVISSIRGCRAGAIVSFKDVRDSIRVACDAIRILARKDGLIQ